MSSRLPRITAAALLRALQRDGWQIHRQSGSHAVLKHERKAGRVVVAVHARGVVKPKTLATVLDQAGLTVEQLRELL